MAGIFFWRARRAAVRGTPIRIVAHAALAVAVIQLLLGIATLLSQVALPLGVLHQAGAITLFCLAVAALRLVYPPRPAGQKI